MRAAQLPWLLLTLLAPLTALGLARQEPASQDRPSLPLDSLPAELDLELPYGLDRAPRTGGSGQAPDPAHAALGRRLFFDPLLSADRTVSCASCHQPEHGFADPRPLSVGIGGQLTERNAPTLLNRAVGTHFMWDGRAASLEEQVLMPLANPAEMALGAERAVERLQGDADYSAAFEQAGLGAPSRAGLTQALAAFVRALTLGDSPVDRFRAGQASQLSEPERAGLWLYESRGRCWRCHSGPNFADDAFHNTGVGVVDGVPEEGRAAHTGDDADLGRFKTPTLRGLAFTAPYMHDGSLATLEEVVRFYRDGGHANPGLSPHMGPIEMDERDVANLVAFLEALSRTAEGPLPPELER